METYVFNLKKKVQVDENTVRKVIFETKSGTRYGLKAVTADGRKLTKFISKDDWDKINVAGGNETFNPDEGDELPR
jgi:hypothetical protein